MTSRSRSNSSEARPAEAYLAVDSPAFWGSAGSALAGISVVLFSLWLFTTSVSRSFVIAFLLYGVFMGVCGGFALRRLRVAWAFCLSLNITGFIVFLFSSAKIRDAAEISLGVAIVPCLICGVFAILLGLGSEDF
jgi:hypothetical protein